jgi:hypothetical protein
MIDARLTAAAALIVLLSGSSLVAQAPFQYREYALESSVATVVALSGHRTNEARTLHERPSVIREVTWRAPYMGLGEGLVDPVNDVVFTFYEDKLYQVVVTYDRGRMAGLTNDDVVDTLSAMYGLPLLQNARAARTGFPTDIAPGMMIVAQWEDPAALLTLGSSAYATQYQLVLISKTVYPQARAAIAEARRLDSVEAPQRELDRRAQAAVAAAVASEHARQVNKATFRP